MKNFFNFCKKNPSFTVGFVFMVIFLLVGIFAPWVAPNDPQLTDVKHSLLKPFVDAQYPLGTDYVGRCLLSRMIYGIRTSVVLGLIAIMIALVLGVSFGIISGMSYPGIVDTVLMRIVDIQLSFPFIVLVIILISLLGQSIPAVILVLALSYWAPYARNIRSSVMIQNNADYIAAARLMGAGNWRIATKYFGRNVIPGILPLVPMDISAAIVVESLLSYMGLGLNPPIISLGNIMADGKNYIATHWWITAIPGLLIVVMAIALTLMGDVLHKHFAKDL